MKANWLIISIILILIIVVIWVIFTQIREYYLQDDPMLHELRHVLAPVHEGIKTIGLYRGKRSYTINKKKIFLCLKDENGNYYDKNMLIFVFLHEFSHTLNTESIGHTPEFNKIFQELLSRASKLGIYNPSIPIIQDYCTH